jgi:nucleoside-diphosphate-sugar epimerase
VIEADAEAVDGEVINVATGRDASVSEIADLVLELTGNPASLKEHVPERPGQVARHVGSTEKAEQLLGWTARTSLEEGLSRTVAWYRENASWVDSSRAAPAGVGRTT